jgi:hypothetical protein
MKCLPSLQVMKSFFYFCLVSRIGGLDFYWCLGFSTSVIRQKFTCYRLQGAVEVALNFNMKTDRPFDLILRVSRSIGVKSSKQKKRRGFESPLWEEKEEERGYSRGGNADAEKRRTMGGNCSWGIHLIQSWVVIERRANLKPLSFHFLLSQVYKFFAIFEQPVIAIRVSSSIRTKRSETFYAQFSYCNN